MYRGAKGVRVCSNTTTKGGWQPHLLSKVVAYVIERRRGHEATRRVGAEPPRVRVRVRVEVRVSSRVRVRVGAGPPLSKHEARAVGVRREHCLEG